MNDVTLLETLQTLEANTALEVNTPKVSRESLLRHIELEIRTKYAHLYPQFYAPDCMQAKVSLVKSRGLEILYSPAAYIRTLTELGFVPHNFRHWPNNRDTAMDRAQFILVNKNIEKIGYKFVLKATLGPNFISIWYRNESRHWRLDLPLFYALEIINKIHDKINSIDNSDVTINKQSFNNPEIAV